MRDTQTIADDLIFYFGCARALEHVEGNRVEEGWTQEEAERIRKSIREFQAKQPEDPFEGLV